VSEASEKKVYGGVVPALEAEVARLRADVEMERGHAEAARADVNALRVRNREAAGRIDRLEAEVARLRSVEEGLKSERVRAEHLSALLHAQDAELKRLRKIAFDRECLPCERRGATE
jgi:outer membrane murein-binding lipoprotein Lpp